MLMFITGVILGTALFAAGVKDCTWVNTHKDKVIETTTYKITVEQKGTVNQ